jgi:Carboxypeptidase regulatory-like domain
MDSDMSDDRGQYRIYGVAPGKYVISATPTRSYRGEGDVAPPPPDATGNDEAYAPVFYPGSNEAAQATSMEIAPGASLEGIDFTMRRVRTVRVSGRVLRAAADERARPVTVILLSKGVIGTMNAPRAMTDAQGRFEIRAVRPGSYTLHAEEFDRQTRLTADVAVEVGAAGVENLAVPLSPGVEVTGTFVAEELKENTGRVGIWVRSRQGGTIGPYGGGLNTNVKEDGTFAVRSVSPGDYEVSVAGLPDGYYLKSIRAADQEALNTGFTVTAGSAPALRIVASPNAGTVEGTVVNQEQKPVLGSTVVLWPVAKGARAALYKTATTDAQGRYTITSVAPGEYRLAAFEFLETGAAQDPEFLQAFESKAEKLSLQEKSRETKALTELLEP